jgi:hypothetical protein
MRRPFVVAGIAAVAIAVAPLTLFLGSDRTEFIREDLKTFDVEASPAMMAEPPAPSAPPALERTAANPIAPTEAIAQTAPRIAYSYGYRFRLPAASVAPLQERHLALCHRLGEMRCRVLSMQRGEEGEGGEARASAALSVQVASSLANRFGAALAQSAGEAGGETIDRTIAAEDLSRQMVDTEARIRTRETLIRRLSGLLETRSGNIQQAVEAERAINQAQEELDAARTWLAEMRGRVAMSKIDIGYDAVGAAPVANRNAVAAAFSTIGEVTTQSFAALVLVAGILAPWALIALLIFLAVRRHRRLNPVES